MESEGEQARRETAALSLCDQCTVVAECAAWLETETAFNRREAVAAGTTPGMRNPRMRRSPELFDTSPFIDAPVEIRLKTPEWERPGYPDPRVAIVDRHMAETRTLATMPLAEALALFETA